MLGTVKVLSFTHFLQGPSATQILADLGADVIKIEPTTGAFERQWSGGEAFLDGVSVFFLLAGRNQRSFSVDLRSEEGKQIIWKLIERADVVVENYRPGAMERLGFGYEQVFEVNPKVVYCSLSGYGSTGPGRNRPGQDLLAQAMSGLAMLNGRRGDPPVLVGSAVVDQHAAVLGALGVVAALYERRDTGRGKKVDSNLLNAALDLQIEPFSYFLNGKHHLYERSDTGISSRFHPAPYGIFETADGYICMSLTPLDKMAQAFDDDSFLEWTREDQFKEREEVNAKVASHVKQKSTNEWYELFDQFGIWYAPVNSYEEVEKDAQVIWNESIMTFEYPEAGTVHVLSHPIRYDDNAPPLRRIPPKLGEHTEEILGELGYDAETIHRLRTQGAVRTKE
jgi:crotonobetainyl-CoA:carnitine CoA-transferase CaiB-like acyl-CoA transferase